MCSSFPSLLLAALSLCSHSLVSQASSWREVCQVRHSSWTAREEEIQVTETKRVVASVPEGLEWHARSCQSEREPCRTLAYDPEDPDVLVDYLQYGRSGLPSVPVSCSLVHQARQLCQTETRRVISYVPEIGNRWEGLATTWSRMKTHVCTSWALAGRHTRQGWEGGREYACRQDNFTVPIPLVVNDSRVEMRSRSIPVGCTALINRFWCGKGDNKNCSVIWLAYCFFLKFSIQHLINNSETK